MCQQVADVALLETDILDNIARLIGKDALFIRCDFGRRSQVSATVSAVEKRFGQVDTLGTNAGVRHYGTMTETSKGSRDRVVLGNLKSASPCARRAIPADANEQPTRPRASAPLASCSNRANAIP